MINMSVQTPMFVDSLLFSSIFLGLCHKKKKIPIYVFVIVFVSLHVDI